MFAREAKEASTLRHVTASKERHCGKEHSQYRRHLVRRTGFRHDRRVGVFCPDGAPAGWLCGVPLLSINSCRRRNGRIRGIVDPACKTAYFNHCYYGDPLPGDPDAAFTPGHRCSSPRSRPESSEPRCSQRGSHHASGMSAEIAFGAARIFSGPAGRRTAAAAAGGGRGAAAAPDRRGRNAATQ